jgi:hypothetical protein
MASPVLSSMVPFGNSSKYRGAETVGSPWNDASADSEQSTQLFERPSTSGPPSLMSAPYGLALGSAWIKYSPSALRSAFSTAV